MAERFKAVVLKVSCSGIQTLTLNVAGTLAISEAQRLSAQTNGSRG